MARALSCKNEQVRNPSEHLVREVRDARAPDDGGVGKPYGGGGQIVEEADAGAEQDRDQRDDDAVQDTGVEELLGDARGGDGDRAVAGLLLRGPQRLER